MAGRTDQLAKAIEPGEGWLALSALLLFILQIGRTAPMARFYTGEVTIWLHYVVLFLVTWLLIKRSISWGWVIGVTTWATILSAVIAIIPLRLGQIWMAGWEQFALDSRNGWLLLSNQLASAGQAGGAVFWSSPLIQGVLAALLTGPALALMLGLFYRYRQPLVGVGFGILVVGFLLPADIDDLFPLYILIVLGTACGAIWIQSMREAEWEQSGADFSENIRVTSGVAGLIVGIVMVFFAYAIPAVPFAEIAEFIEDALTFEQQAGTPGSSGGDGGAAAPRSAPDAQTPDIGPSTFLPTSYLLGSPPELADTPVFEATIEGLPPNPADFHWQTASFDQYSGFGWARSRERPVELGVGEVWQDEFTSLGASQIRQTITWLGPPASNYVIAGRLQRINQPVTLLLRPEDDLVRLQPAIPDVLPSYTAIAVTRQINPEELDQADYDRLTNTRFYERHTQLPDNISDRVLELARELTAEAAGPYSQAKALESYLRTLPYNLDIEPPPAGREPVDYFLFDLREGYCDLYATAMIVMARTLGLPARLAVGYNTVTPDDEGRLIITRDRSHSWAEIYFPDYGWVEFEPTASFPTSGEITPSIPDLTAGSDGLEPGGADFPIGQAAIRRWSLWVGAVVAAAAAGGIFWLRAKRSPVDVARQLARRWATRGDEWAQLLDLARLSGYEPDFSHTPREFLAGWARFLNAGRPFTRLGEQFAGLLEQERYGHGVTTAEKRRLRSLVGEFRNFIR